MDISRLIAVKDADNFPEPTACAAFLPVNYKHLPSDHIFVHRQRNPLHRVIPVERVRHPALFSMPGLALSAAASVRISANMTASGLLRFGLQKDRYRSNARLPLSLFLCLTSFNRAPGHSSQRFTLDKLRQNGYYKGTIIHYIGNLAEERSHGVKSRCR